MSPSLKKMSKVKIFLYVCVLLAIAFVSVVVFRQRPDDNKILSQDHSVLVFRHMSKTGGTFLRTVLPQIIKGEPTPSTNWQKEAWYVNDHLIFISDRVAWRDDLRATRNNTFVLMTVRHPCSWYRSYYYYRPEHPIIENRLKPSFTRSLNDWVNGITLDKSFGYMSFRFWKAYVAPRLCYRVPYVEAKKEGPCSLERAKNELKSLDPKKLAHCWMLTTNLFSTLAECLKSWDGLSVNWDNFEKLSSPKASSEVFGGEKKDPRRDQIKTCTNEYSPATHALIEEADSELFRLFRIPSCCANNSIPLQFPFGKKLIH